MKIGSQRVERDFYLEGMAEVGVQPLLTNL